MKRTLQRFGWCGIVLGLSLITNVLAKQALAQDDDPPGRVARLGFMEGSVSFQPAGEDDWVGAVPNRPMSTGDQLWTDENSRAEVQLGSAVIRLAPLTTFSFLNLDDDTVQVQLSSGSINVTVRRLGDNEDFEVDTPNQALSRGGECRWNLHGHQCPCRRRRSHGEWPDLCAAWRAERHIQRNGLALR